MRQHAAVLGVGLAVLSSQGAFAAYDDAGARAAIRAEPSPWRDDLGDPVLADLLARVDAQSLDVRAALARVQRSKAELDVARGEGRPSVTVGVAAATGERNFRTATSAATPTLEAGYELDLWRKFANGREAASRELAASRFDLQAARLVAAAETARAYVAFRLAQQATERAEADARLADRTRSLTAVRVQQGGATRLDLAVQDEAAARAADAVAQAQDAVGLQLQRIRTLAGDRTLTLPPGPPPPAALADEPRPDDADRRPDVQAAFARFHAADARRAAAVAASRPEIRLAAALGAPDAVIATLLDVRALAWAAAATISEDLVGGAARRAQARAAASETDLADIAYRKAVLDAWTDEVRAAAGVHAAGRELRQAQAAVALAQSSLEIARSRHAAGAVDGLALAAREGELQASLQALADARARAAEARVAMVLAHGGSP